jgi:hypothetical protein
VRTLYCGSWSIPHQREVGPLGFGRLTLSFTAASGGRYNLTINDADRIDRVDHDSPARRLSSARPSFRIARWIFCGVRVLARRRQYIDQAINGMIYHAPRLLLQPILVGWALFCGDVTDWPFPPKAGARSSCPFGCANKRRESERKKSLL